MSIRPPKDIEARSRTWCVTSYNEHMNPDTDQTKYLIYQRETCPDTGRLHWQMYMVFHHAKQYKAVQKFVGDMCAHCEVRRKSHKAASDYCKKEESAIPNTVVEFGEHDEQGKRTDLDIVAEKIKEGNDITWIIENYTTTWIRYEKSLTNLVNRYRKARTGADDIKVEVYFGPAGTGKSRKVFTEHTNEEIYVKDNTKWWNGYEGQPIVVFEDFRGEIPYGDLLRIIDRYQYQGETKGGYVTINSKHFIFTSNHHPQVWYPMTPEEYNWTASTPLKRRITNIIEML